MTGVAAWTLLGLAGVVTASLLVGLAVAAVLGQVSRDVNELVDDELWAMVPATRSRR